MVKMLNILNKVKYRKVRGLFEELLKNGGECFNGEWIESNIDSIRRLFVKRSGLEIWTNSSGINTPRRKEYIEDIVLSANNLVLSAKNYAVTLNKPSEGCIIIEKGDKNNRYAMYLYGKEKERKPSQIIFSYYNI